MPLFRNITDRNIWLINISILFVGAASGVAISLLALHLDDRGFDEGEIGALAAWGAAGIVLAASVMGWLIKKFTSKAILVTSLFLYGGTVLILPYATVAFESAALLRIVDGAASAGIWICCETILLARAQADAKATVTSLYAACISIGYMLGSVLANQVAQAYSLEVAFMVGGALSALTALIVWARLDSMAPEVCSDNYLEGVDAHEPEPCVHEVGKNEGKLSTFLLIWKIKNSCFGNFSYGYFQASVVLFLPLYLIADKGISREETMLIPAFFAFGMLLFVNAAGVLGDRWGHLRLMRILGVIGACTVIGFVVLNQFFMMALAVGLAGATLASISPISLALQGVILPPKEYGRGSSVYNGFYALGMMLGPAVTGAIFQVAGGPAMLYHLAALWGAFVLFTLVFSEDDPAAARGTGKEKPVEKTPELAA